MRSLLLIVALAGCSSGGPQSDWERQNLKAQPAEEQIEPPPYPKGARLLEFTVYGTDHGPGSVRLHDNVRAVVVDPESNP